MNLTIKGRIKKYLDDKPLQLRAVSYLYCWINLYGRLFLRLLRGRFPVNISFGMFNKYPRILQFPVTNRCNLNCKMCGLLYNERLVELDPEQLEKIFRSKIFQNIRSVGINGGEPFLNRNLYNYIHAVIKSFNKLETICLISNGTLTDTITLVLPDIKRLCSSNGIKLLLSISVDGIDDVHDVVRGKHGSFKQTERTCAVITQNLQDYCDSFGIICTLTKYNTYQINAVDAWANKNTYCISYNIATQHARLNTADLNDDFTVFADEHIKMMSAEFFYGKFIETRSPSYFALYKYISTRKRATGCEFKYDGITLLADGNIAYCATRSRILGNAVDEDALHHYNSNLPYKKSEILSKCETCSHYTGTLLFKDNLEYIGEILKIIGSPFKYR